MLKTLHTIDNADVKVYLSTQASDYAKENATVVDFSSLEAVARCPMLGITKYFLNKTTHTNSRELALEAGTAIHEFYHAICLIQLFYNGNISQFHYQGNRLFKDRWKVLSEIVYTVPIHDVIDKPETDGDFIIRNIVILDYAQEFCLQALYSCNYEDSELDKKRTLSNIEYSCLLMLKNWDFDEQQVFVKDYKQANCLTGIELPVDFMLEYRKDNGSGEDSEIDYVRYKGLIDGVFIEKRSGRIYVEDLKSTGRITPAWKITFILSHQLTGYNLYMSLLLEKALELISVRGVALPIPKADPDTKGIWKERFVRDEDANINLFTWVLGLVQQINSYKQNPESIPMNTHSCNNWYRECNFIPYCGSEKEERKLMFHDSLFKITWEPLDGEM